MKVSPPLYATWRLPVLFRCQWITWLGLGVPHPLPSSSKATNLPLLCVLYTPRKPSVTLCHFFYTSRCHTVFPGWQPQTHVGFNTILMCYARLSSVKWGYNYGAAGVMHLCFHFMSYCRCLSRHASLLGSLTVLYISWFVIFKRIPLSLHAPLSLCAARPYSVLNSYYTKQCASLVMFEKKRLVL